MIVDEPEKHQVNYLNGELYLPRRFLFLQWLSEKFNVWFVIGRG